MELKILSIKHSPYNVEIYFDLTSRLRKWHSVNKANGQIVKLRMAISV